MKNSFKKTNKISVTVKVGERKIIVEDLDNPINKKVYPFRGIQSNGRYAEIVKVPHKKEVYKDIYYNLLDEGIIKEDSTNMWKNVCKNIDLSIMNVLYQFESMKINGERKDNEYAKIMTINLERQMYEKNRDYKKRLQLVKRVELENSGILLNYDLSGINILGRGFFDKIRAIKSAIKNRRISKISFLNRKEEEPYIYEEEELQTAEELQETSPKLTLNDRINSIQNKLKENKTFKSAKGLINDLRKKAQEPKIHKKIKQKLARVGALTLMTVGVASMLTPNIAQTAQPESQTKTNTNNNSQSINYEAKNMSKEIFFEKENNELQVNLKETLKEIVDLNIGKNTTFNLTEGTYWESPDGTGAHGNIKAEDKLYISDVDVIDENGFKHYKVSDGLNINEIKEKHPNGTFSYHINCIDEDKEKIYGWVTDDTTIEKIENQMTISRLKTLMNYLSPEAKEIFYNIINDNSGKISESNKDILQTLIKEAKQAENTNLEAEIEEGR